MRSKLKILATLSVEGSTAQDLQRCLFQHHRVSRASQTETRLAFALSDDAWTHVMGIPTLYRLVELSSKSEELTSGRLGKLLGGPLLTDAYSTTQFLPKGISICSYTP